MGLFALLADSTVATVVIGAAMLGACSGALGTFAVQRRQSLIGDALAHAALPGVVAGYLIAGERQLGALLLGALVTGSAAALFATFLSRVAKVKLEAALGTALSIGFAVGAVGLSYVQRLPGAGHAGLDVFLFGQAAATLRSDLWLIGGVLVGSFAIVALFWKQLKLVTFDPVYARALGYRVGLIEGLLTGLLATAIVIGLQLVGVVLMAALVVAPAVAARQWTKDLGSMFVLAGAFGMVAAVVGAVASAEVRGLATGPVVVLVATTLAFASLVLAPRRSVAVES